VCHWYPSFSISNKWHSPSINLKEIIREVLPYVQNKASPGTPLSQFGSSNGEVMETLGLEAIVDMVYLRLIKFKLYTPEAVREIGPVECVKQGLMDPVRVFVKNEPHSLKKRSTGRVRLIHSVSLLDKIIELLLVRSEQKVQISNWKTIPSKPGISFEEDGRKAIYDKVISWKPFGYSSDMSHWDMSVTDWLMQDDMEITLLKCLNPTSLWEDFVRVKEALEEQAVYQFSDGELVIPHFRGITNSGKQKTSSSNSRMRVLLAKHCGSEDVIAAGDDSCEKSVFPPEIIISNYEAYGFTVKQLTHVVSEFEFCSHVYKRDLLYSVNEEKILMNLCHKRDSLSLCGWLTTMAELNHELGTHPLYPGILEDLRKIGFLEPVGAQRYGQ